tara:strand:- start:3491 stop:3754 length:264 start_codon:yes stop_codon:yes gene_type:complete
MSKVQYIPNLKRFASKMQKENFRGKRAQSSFPYDAHYLPRVETDRFIWSNPTTIMGALHINNLYHLSSEVVTRKKLVSELVDDILGL